MNWIMLAIASGLFIGLKDVIRKGVLKKQSPMNYLAVASLLQLLFVLVFIPKVNFHFSTDVLMLILTRSAVGIIAFVSLIYAMRELPLSTIAPLTNIQVLFGLLLGVMILSEHIGTLDLAGTLVIFLGSYILDSDGRLKDYHKPISDLINSNSFHLVFVFAAFSAIYIMLTKLATAKIDVISLYFFHSLISGFIFLIGSFIFDKGIWDVIEGWKSGGIWLIILILVAIAADFTQYFSLSDPASKIALVIPLLQLATLFDVFFGGKIFHEKHMIPKALGSIIMILGVTLIFL